MQVWGPLGIDPERCYRCGSAESIHVDHIWPRALGGTDDPTNLVPLCARHNLSKSARDPYEWACDRSQGPWSFHPAHHAWMAAAGAVVPVLAEP